VSDYSGDHGPVRRPRARPAKPPPPGQLSLFDPAPVLPSGKPTVPEYDVALAPLAQKHSRTSVEAANLMAGTAGKLRARIYAWLLERPEGATDEEGQGVLGIEGNTYRPRRVELEEAGLVYDSGRTRLTVKKRKAVVWRARRLEGE
jgi:hypothetical protein